MDKRRKKGRRKRLKRQRERRKLSRQNKQRSVNESGANEEKEIHRDFARTRDELLIAQREYTERLAKARDPVTAAALVIAIQVTTYGIAKLDSTPLDRLGGIKLKIMNKYTGKEYRKWVSWVTKVVFRTGEEEQ